MAASRTLPQQFSSRKLTITRSGVLTLTGFGIKVRMQSGHLEIEDGIGPDRRRLRLPRVGHGLKRLVVIGSNGFVTLEAIRWLADQEAAFAMLDRDGKVLVITGPVHSADARLRRGQALALVNGAALKISRDLIAAKLEGQALVMAQDFRNPGVAEVITKFRAQLSTADTFERIRLIESQAARAYWTAWSNVALVYPRDDLKRIPEHWKTFGQRISVLTGSPRLATNPPNAILNFCYALLEAESRLALAALGLDPAIGLLHTDTPARDSLACDLMEVVRPKVDAWLLNWVQKELFARSWFFETREGNCRLAASFAAKLAETASTWRMFVAPWAEYIARELWTTTRKRSPGQALPPTRLTQQKKREVKGSAYSISIKRASRPPRVCVDCGAHVNPGHDRCKACALALSTKSLVEGAKLGRIVAHSAEAQRSRSASKRRHDTARQEWERSRKASITEQTYRTQTQPKLKGITLSAIMKALQVSVVYASHIRRGKLVPHPRHWEALAALANRASTGGIRKTEL
jgi:CRISPR-associated endonuclease Cas1